jgi:hypothetical protein
MTPDATNLARQYADLLRANGCSERTIDNYLYCLNGFVKFLGERPLTGASGRTSWPTAVYTHLARTWLAEVNSPLDSLKDKHKAPPKA